MDTDRNARILHLYNIGISSSDIGKQYSLSTRQIQRILFKDIRRGVGKSKDNTLGNLRAIIIDLMTEQGRDFNRCEICKCTIPKGKFDLHHTKYKDATYYDLQVVCRRCNTAPVNRYLS